MKKLLALLAVLISACSAPHSKMEPNRRSLPGMSGNADCLVAPQAVEVCEWAGPADAVIVGTIERMSRSESPVGFADGTTGYLGDCPAGANAALHVTVTVTSVLFGNAPKQVTIAVGPSTLSNWTARPDLSSSEVVWADDQRQGLYVGQQVGAAVYSSDGMLWGARSRLFEEVDGKVRFQAGEQRCREPLPQFGGSVLELSQSLQSCSFDSESNRALDEFFSAGSPAVLAECIAERGADLNEPRPECATNRDCRSGYTCLEAICAKS